MTDMFLCIFQISAVSSAVILAVFIYRTAFSKRIKYGVLGVLWALVLLRLCLPFTFKSPVHLSQILPQKQAAVQVQKPSADISAAESIPDADISADDSVTRTIPANNAGIDETENDSDISRDNVTYYNPDTGSQYTLQGETPSYTKPQPAPAKTDWLGIAAYTWIAGMGVILLIAFLRGISFGRKVNRCCGCGKAEIIADELRRDLKIRRKVSVKVFGETAAPALFGLFRPKLLLPESCVNVNGETLRCILAHELCHVKRLDILKGYIWLAAKAVHWFNPLVWIAYRAFRDDMEIGCDEMVLKVLGRESRFAYSLSLIDAFRSYRRALPGAVPLFEKEPELADRVKRMLKPKKRSKAAAVLSVLLALIIALAGFTTACSPAAQTAKTTDTAQQTSAQTPSAQQTTAYPASPSPSASPEPNTVTQWTDNVKSGKVTLDVNAQVVTPNVNSFSLYYANKTQIPQDTVDKLKTYFFGDAAVYNYTNRMMDEEDLKSTTAEYQAMLDGTYKFDKDDDKKKLINSDRLHINAVKKDLKKEPDTGLVPVDLNLTANKDEINGITGSGDRISILSGGSSISLSKHDPRLEQDVNGEYIHGLTSAAITKEQALVKAQSLLDELGLNDYKLYNDNSGRNTVNMYLLDSGNTGNPYVYCFEYTRVIGGVQLAGGVSEPETVNMDNEFHFIEEKIKIKVNDSGIMSFVWSDAFSTKPTNSNTQLMDVEKIKQIVKDQLLNKYQDYYGIKDTKTFKLDNYTLHINSMKLEYARVPIVDGGYDTLYLVPVWNVYATNTTSAYYSNDEFKELHKTSHTRASIELTINAIDGSVVGNQSDPTF